VVRSSPRRPSGSKIKSCGGGVRRYSMSSGREAARAHRLAACRICLLARPTNRPTERPVSWRRGLRCGVDRHAASATCERQKDQNGQRQG
jgi:hypothetical protein